MNQFAECILCQLGVVNLLAFCDVVVTCAGQMLLMNSLVYGCGNKMNLSRHLLYVLSAGVVKGMCRRVCRIGCALWLPSVYFDVLCCFLSVVLLHVQLGDFFAGVS